MNVGTGANIGRVGVGVGSGPDMKPQPARNSAPTLKASARQTDFPVLIGGINCANNDFIHISKKLSLLKVRTAIPRG